MYHPKPSTSEAEKPRAFGLRIRAKNQILFFQQPTDSSLAVAGQEVKGLGITRWLATSRASGQKLEPADRSCSQTSKNLIRGWRQV